MYRLHETAPRWQSESPRVRGRRDLQARDRPAARRWTRLEEGRRVGSRNGGLASTGDGSDALLCLLHSDKSIIKSTCHI